MDDEMIGCFQFIDMLSERALIKLIIIEDKLLGAPKCKIQTKDGSDNYFTIIKELYQNVR